MGVVINLTAVLAAAVVQIIIGALWYGPLFGKIWMKLAGFTQQDMEMKKKGAGKAYAAGFAGAVLMSYVLAYMVALIQPLGWLGGSQLGFLLWLGFVATTFLSQVIWVNKSKTLYMLDVGYYLVVLILSGILLTVWQ